MQAQRKAQGNTWYAQKGVATFYRRFVTPSGGLVRESPQNS